MRRVARKAYLPEWLARFGAAAGLMGAGRLPAYVIVEEEDEGPTSPENGFPAP